MLYATTSEYLLQGWGCNRRREVVFFSLSLSVWYDLSPYQLLLLVNLNFISLSLSFFAFYKNCAHLHNSWVSIIKLTHARTQKYNLHGTRNERRTCRTISFCIYMVQVDIYMCALSIALFCKLLNKNNTITIS